MKVRDIMIQISECALVSRDHSLQAAMIMLSAIRRRFRDMDFRPRFVLVQNEAYEVVGVLREGEIMRALAGSMAGEVFSLEKFSAAAARITAGEAMIAYSPAEIVAADTPISEAVAQMVNGPLRHLLVTEGNATIGVLRLTEIFALLSQRVFHPTGN